ncbi:lisH domain and HEAT repeat-containing protein KIAA1468-like isoform X1 [Myzus persicae]|uniref:lisH domain and HEAT repeat-containing protein KIAA1468-like isoform X1 n=2 Tax=Myzus persicae TaxID=13164 RepID=UPI000B932EA0|nr:lisH domain and HEAT repeat-containing protein KIAA1468-like isoform X1 [Myzus persicae]
MAEDGPTGPSYGDIAKKLLDDRLLLTALELHYELVEAGKELPGLREFFSNPSNFEHSSPQNDNISITLSMARSSSQATLDSLEMARYSEDGDKTVNERVAILEFELRKAKDTINALRTNLTVAAVESEEFAGEDPKISQYDDRIKPHEQRVLNFLVNEYLMQHNYKLTSITFADENENQDFEIWDDVGLNISRPPHLLSLYRDRAKSYFKSDVSCQSEIQECINIATQMDGDCSDFTKIISQLENDNENLLSQLQLLKSTKDLSDITPNISKEKWLRPDKSKKQKVLRNCESSVFQDMLINKCWPDQQLPLMYLDVDLDVLSDDGVELNLYPILRILENQRLRNQNDENILESEKQEDFIILSVLLMHIHPDVLEREKILYSLFNMRKKPNKKERSSIIGGLSWFLKYSNSEFFERELLPQLWHLLTDKYVEKRLLVAEACSWFSPLISCESRQSLLSVLQQMLIEDTDESVRAATIKSIAINTVYIYDSDKYAQIEELLFIGLKDNLKYIVEITIGVLLPVLAKWAFDKGRLQSNCYMRLMNSLTTQIKTLDSQKKSQKTDQLESNCCYMVNAIRSILPYLVLYVASAPECISLRDEDTPRGELRTGFADICVGLSNPQVFYSDPNNTIGTVMCTFDAVVEDNKITWPRLQWLFECMLPSLIESSSLVSIENQKLLQSLMALFQSFCYGFGSKFTQNKVKPLFVEKIQSLEKSLGKIANALPSMTLLCIYMCSVLAPIEREDQELEGTLKKYVCTLPLCGVPINILQFTVSQLALNHQRLHELILSSLWEGVISQKEAVRLAVTELLSSIMPYLSDINITNRIVPALITLSNDSNCDVKIALVPVLGQLMMSTNNKDTIEKCRFQMKSLMDDRTLSDSIVFVSELITAFGKLAPKSDQAYREDVLMVQLNMYSGVAVRTSDITRKIELTRVLLDAFSTVLYECTLSPSAITSSLLPSLRCLEELCNINNLSQKELSAMLIKEAESRLPPSQSETGTSSVTQDLKPKMVKMFQSSNIAKQTMFWKKNNQP